MYYRNPEGFRDGQESLWITYDDAYDDHHVRTKERKGFRILEKYGPCPGLGRPDKNGKRVRINTELWTPILTYKGTDDEGAGEFPASQVVAMRWYHVMDARTNGRGCQSLHGMKIRFPQYIAQRQSGELTIVEYGCDECNGKRTFHQPHHLARHLRVTHGYDMVQIFALGEKIGVDFAAAARLIFTPPQPVDDDYDDVTSTLPDIQDEDDDIEVVRAGKIPQRTVHAVPSVLERLGVSESDEPVTDEMPVWARMMFDRLDAVEKRPAQTIIKQVRTRTPRKKPATTTR